MNHTYGFSVRDALLGVLALFVSIVSTHAATPADGSIPVKATTVLRVIEGVGTPVAPLAPIDTEDGAIRRGVEKALRDLDSDDNGDIRVTVRNGTVWLTGSVPTWQGNASRVYAVRSVRGVRSIVNRLRVVPLNDHRR